MKVLLFILQKEFRQIIRDKTILAMMLVAPNLQLIIFPLAANFEVKNINVVFVDQDHSSYSQKLIGKIASSGYFRVIGHAVSYHEALTFIEESKVDIVLEIPHGFERNLLREGSQKVNIVADAINGTKSALGGAYLTAVIADYNRSLNLVTKMPAQNVSSQSGMIDITYSDWFNPHKQYKYLMVPGLLVLLLTLIGGFITSLNIVSEKEIGTIEQINVTPMKKWQFILGKLIPFWVIGMIVFTIGVIMMYLVYGISPQGSMGLLYLFAAVYMVALLGLGLLISTISNNQLQAMFIAFFFMMVFMLMSGFFTSTDSMPTWARWFSEFNPVTHFVRVVRLIVLKGSGFEHVKMELFYLVIFAAVFNSAAILNYRKTN